MNLNEQLMSKNGLAAVALSKLFLTYTPGAKIPTVTELCELLDTSRGTVQNGIRTLTNAGAVTIENHGHLGSLLVSYDQSKLLQFAGIDFLVGAMPLPYSHKYEGLATGLVNATENQLGIKVSISFMRGARNRLAMLTENRYDFVVVSKYAAEEFQKHEGKISIVKELSRESYCRSHVIIFHDPDQNEVEDGMRIGIDTSSIDQENMTRFACKGKNVTYVPVEYNSLLSRVESGELDATVWNLDEITDQMAGINFNVISELNMTDTIAVIVASSERPEMISLLNRIIDPMTIEQVQKLVEEGKITPSY